MFKLDARQREGLYIPLDTIKAEFGADDIDAVAAAVVSAICEALDFAETETLMDNIIKEIEAGEAGREFSSWSKYKRMLWMIRTAYLSGVLFGVSSTISNNNEIIKRMEGGSEAGQARREIAGS